MHRRFPSSFFIKKIYISNIFQKPGVANLLAEHIKNCKEKFKENIEKEFGLDKDKQTETKTALEQ